METDPGGIFPIDQQHLMLHIKPVSLICCHGFGLADHLPDIIRFPENLVADLHQIRLLIVIHGDKDHSVL